MTSTAKGFLVYIKKNRFPIVVIWKPRNVWCGQGSLETTKAQDVIYKIRPETTTITNTKTKKQTICVYITIISFVLKTNKPK